MAKNLKLPKIGADKEPQDFKTRLDGETAELLDLYIKAYKEDYGQSIKAGDMIAHIVNVQLTTDRRFKTYVKAHQKPTGVMAAAAR